ncbi:hypothetical protein [Streptomyces erythrochromogenes]|uniref:hypothetical protein n=1 Tax=Streptomyces erythrochromogenes TaxID=285574 RepID=UPI00386855E1|nr:hypothetical protein OG489_19570 [Streptomyces erythrochromogenes]
MAENHNSQVPEGNYDPAGSTQMFRAFVEEAAPARQAGATGSRQQRRAEQEASTSSGPGVKVGLVLALVLVIGAAAWVVLH